MFVSKNRVILRGSYFSDSNGLVWPVFSAFWMGVKCAMVVVGKRPVFLRVRKGFGRGCDRVAIVNNAVTLCQPLPNPFQLLQ